MGPNISTEIGPKISLDEFGTEADAEVVGYSLARRAGAGQAVGKLLSDSSAALATAPRWRWPRWRWPWRWVLRWCLDGLLSSRSTGRVGRNVGAHRATTAPAKSMMAAAKAKAAPWETAVASQWSSSGMTMNVTSPT
jgi:hypothetical protein